MKDSKHTRVAFRNCSAFIIMAAIRSNLQKSLFDDERLIAVCQVLKVDNKKKKKDSYLCLTGQCLDVRH